MVVHGLAASIRAAEESEVFDLAGQNVTSIQQTIRSAFEKPVSLEDEEMIRITFVTGAGKLARSRYDEGAARAVTTVLKELGYEEDRGASCIAECAGTFKSQHDTGKNLKTVVVYPKVINSSTSNSCNPSGTEVESLVPENSPDYKIAMSSMTVFKNIVLSKCPSWTDKKGCLNCVGALLTLVQELDQKLIKGVQLDPSEQDFYDKVLDLQQKQIYLKEQIQNQVEAENITTIEKQILLHLNAERIASAKNPTVKEKAQQRREILEQIDPIPYHPLKFQPQINKLRKELIPIYKVEQSAKGRLLTLKETQIFAKKDDVLKMIEQYELSSRGWFEDETTFQARVQHSRDSAEKTKKSSIKKTTSSASTNAYSKSSSLPAVNKWVTPGQSSTAAYNYKTAKKKKLKGPDVFNAMMMDSSSDEESDAEEEERKIIISKPKDIKPTVKKPTASKKDFTQNTAPDVRNQTNNNVPLGQKKLNKTALAAMVAQSPPVESDDKNASKKKKKKKKSKKNKAIVEDITTATIIADKSDVVSEKKKEINGIEKEEYSTGIVIVILSLLLRLIKEFLFPLIVAITTWIIGFLFGRPKKKRSKVR